MMKMISMSAALGLVLLAAPARSQSPADAKQDVAKDLAKLFSDYDEQWLKLNPAMATMRGDHRYNDRLGNSLTAEHLSATEKLNRDVLDRLESIDPNSLSDVDRVSYHVFRYERELDLEGITSGATYASTLLPVDQIGCVPIYLAMFGSGSMVQPFRTVQDYENWINRSAEFEHWVDHAIANMRRRGR